MHRLVRCKLEHRCWRVRGKDVSFTDVKIKIPWGCEWRHAPEARAEDFGRFEKVESWELDSEREGSTFGARRGQMNLPATGAARNCGGRRKSQNRKNMYLSPYVEEPLNSKVIKSFVPELRSRKCFSCFGIPMFYVYMLWTFYVRFTYSCMGMVHVCKWINQRFLTVGLSRKDRQRNGKWLFGK